MIRMNVGLEWLDYLAGRWWNHMVYAGWQAAVVGLVLLLVVNLFGRRWPAPLRYALLVLALLKFACPPLLPVPTGLFTRLASSSFAAPTAQERKPVQASASPLLIQRWMAAAYQSAAGLKARMARATEGMPWCRWLMLVHGLGALYVVASVRKQAAGLRSMARESQLVRGGDLPREYRDLALELGVYRIPNLVVSDQVVGPMTFGVKKPAIVLPTRILQRLSPLELKAVLAHELAHCQRGDLWINWIQVLLFAVWWFHPVLWWVDRTLRNIREDCCDDLLLARGMISSDAYCEVLLRTASELAPPPPLYAAVGFGDGLHPLGRRLARIMDWTLRRSERVSLLGATTVLFSAALLLPGMRSPDARAAVRPAASTASLASAALDQSLADPQTTPPFASTPAVAGLGAFRAKLPGQPSAVPRGPVASPSGMAPRARLGPEPASSTGIAPMLGIIPTTPTREIPAQQFAPRAGVANSTAAGPASGAFPNPYARVAGLAAQPAPVVIQRVTPPVVYQINQYVRVKGGFVPSSFQRPWARPSPARGRNHGP